MPINRLQVPHSSRRRTPLVPGPFSCRRDKERVQIEMAEEPPAQMIVRHETSARLIDAWVNSKKAKADNRADRELAHAESKLNKKKVSLESKEKTIELNAEMYKQMEIERIKNEEAISKKKFDERTVGIEAKREQNKHKIDQMAQKFRSTGTLPKKCFGFCSDD